MRNKNVQSPCNLCHKMQTSKKFIASLKNSPFMINSLNIILSVLLLKSRSWEWCEPVTYRLNNKDTESFLELWVETLFSKRQNNAVKSASLSILHITVCQFPNNHQLPLTKWYSIFKNKRNVIVERLTNNKLTKKLPNFTCYFLFSSYLRLLAWNFSKIACQNIIIRCNV